MMNEVQKHSLEILKWINEVCCFYDIKYVLYGGTLLGSIRHSGFIPWDDDVDIAMDRENYEKFITILEEVDLPEGFFIQSRKEDPYYTNEYLKIRSSKLKMRDNLPKTQQLSFGAWVDVFPLDNIDSNEVSQRKLFKKLSRLNYSIQLFLIVNEYHNLEGSLVYLIKRTLRKINEHLYKFYFWLPILFSKRKRIIKRQRYKTTPLIADLTFTGYSSFEEFSQNIFEKTMFEGVVYCDFEDQKFPIPQMYHEILTQQYGDYMTPPPISEREQHSIIYE